MRRIGLAAAAIAILAGCSSDPKPAPAPPPPPPPPPPPAAPIRLPPAPISVAPPPPPDQCGAYELTGLVGKPRSEIPVPLIPSRRRVVCTTCPRTQDFNPGRMTIEYDAATGRVTSVTCG
ncbi:MAG: hypothetical protein B7Y99_11170 [Caulobacterales bacterium 32-69-10]|nr:MAG: hypothetical protein B7Y99_11170 [Caulobacterales bacterium 32-69-10]